MKPRIATIINFCTNEARFLSACIEECSHFSRQIIIPVCDHFFDGDMENRALLEQIYAAFPNCLFIEYPFIPRKIPKRIFRKIDPVHFWHSASRALAKEFLDEEISQVLFLDADEIPEGKKFLEWLEISGSSQYTVQRLRAYWYFREPRYRANRLETTPLIVQRRSLERSILLHEEERDAIEALLPGPKRRFVSGLDGEPMFHHFSWVRTKEEMLRKVSSWGHCHDRDWKTLVEQEFSRPFNGTDFIHGYEFQECQAPFDISLGPVSFQPSSRAASVRRLSSAEFLELLGIRSQIWRKLFSMLIKGSQKDF